MPSWADSSVPVRAPTTSHTLNTRSPTLTRRGPRHGRQRKARPRGGWPARSTASPWQEPHEDLHAQTTQPGQVPRRSRDQGSRDLPSWTGSSARRGYERPRQLSCYLSARCSSPCPRCAAARCDRSATPPQKRGGKGLGERRAFVRACVRSCLPACLRRAPQCAYRPVSVFACVHARTRACLGAYMSACLCARLRACVCMLRARVRVCARACARASVHTGVSVRA